MGFYVRKSINVGGIRFNFSNSGLGVSAGIKGFRIGTGPKGNYIHVGANGFYYRKTIGDTNRVQQSAHYSPDVINNVQTQNYDFTEIESGNVSFMTDSSFAEIIAELNQKCKKVPLTPFVFLVLVFFAMYRTEAIALAVILIPVMTLIDKRRKTTYLLYNFDDHRERKLQSFYDSFDSLIKASRKWHISSSAGLRTDYDKKVNSGADSLVKRTKTTVEYGLPKHVISNIRIPVIGVGQQTLYFLPERILIKDGNNYGTINYEDLDIEFGNTRFIESEIVPHDSVVVGKTWKYVNKKGGPDKRFKDNAEYPIVNYSAIHFKSKTGLNELIHISRPNIGEEIFKALKSKPTSISAF